jgi:hypothetical protein
MGSKKSESRKLNGRVLSGNCAREAGNEGAGQKQGGWEMAGRAAEFYGKMAIPGGEGERD